MLPNSRKRMAVAITGLLAVVLGIACTSEVRAQGYTYTPGGGYSYSGAPSGGYSYPSYSYGYWSQGRSTAPSGYYLDPSGRGYYYQSFAPATTTAPARAPAPAPMTRRPAQAAPAPVAESSRVAELEARIQRLESVINGLTAGAGAPSAPGGTSNYSYYPGGDTRIERDSRYPNWSFDHSLWLAHNL